MEDICVHMGFYLLHNDRRANGDEVTAVIVRQGAGVLQSLLSALCIASSATEHGSTPSSSVFIPIDLQRECNIAFDATLSSSFPKDCTNEGPVESSEGYIGKMKRFVKTNLTTEKGNELI